MHCVFSSVDTQIKYLSIEKESTLRSPQQLGIRLRKPQSLEKGREEMATHFEQCAEFMRAFGQEVYNHPSIRDKETQELRYELIREEVQELREGLDKDDLVEVADALTDILYVVYGAGHAFGLDLDACFNEVHRSNMSKLNEDGSVKKRADGKVLKGPNYSPPNLVPIIMQTKKW